MLYKLTISPYSSFSYPIQSDTLFGAFCWSYKYLYGTEKLEKFLEICITQKPPIIFSNMFFQNMLPIPLYALNKIKNNDYGKDLEKYKKIKKINKNSVLPKQIFLQVLENNYENIVDNIKLPKLYTQTETHNMVSRDTNIVDNIDGSGSLYSIDTYYSKVNFDIYILCEDEITKYMPVLEIMFELGIGGKKSTGKGGFKIIKEPTIEQELIKNFENANGFVSISNFIPDKIDPTNGYYSIISKFPKLDREFANSETPFKKPLAMIEAGSCFYYSLKRDYCGVCLDNISSLYKKIMINGCGIAIPMCLDEDNN